MCMVFLECLRGDANNSLNELPRNFSFCELASSFLNKLFEKARVLGNLVNILNVKQRKDESLMDYITCFTTKSLRLKCTLDELICLAYLNGLVIWPLYTVCN